MKIACFYDCLAKKSILPFLCVYFQYGQNCQMGFTFYYYNLVLMETWKEETYYSFTLVAEEEEEKEKKIFNTFIN